MSKKDDVGSEAKSAGAAIRRRVVGARTGGGLSDRSAEDVAFVEALAKVLSDNELAEIEVTRDYEDEGELTIRLTRYAPMAAYAPMPQVPAPAHPALIAPAVAIAAAAAEPAAGPHPGAVASPMVGTVYLSAEPGAAPFVRPGDSVTAGQTLLIVEAMKTMNQIPSPRSGVVREILVVDGQPVEYGAPLIVLE